MFFLIKELSCLNAAMRKTCFEIAVGIQLHQKADVVYSPHRMSILIIEVKTRRPTSSLGMFWNQKNAGPMLPHSLSLSHTHTHTLSLSLSVLPAGKMHKNAQFRTTPSIAKKKKEKSQKRRETADSPRPFSKSIYQKEQQQ